MTTTSAWCPECRTRRPITDQFTDDSGDSRLRIEVTSVTVLECDHTIEVTTDGGRSPLRQAGLPRAYSLPDPFLAE